MVRHDVSLKPFNTFGIDQRAEEMLVLTDVDELKILEERREPPALVLGGGSNILLTRDVPGLTVHNDLRGIEVVRETGDHVWITAMAGEVWHDVVLYAIERGWGGIENLSLIPGRMGAAPMQNIGAYGVELEQVFERLEAWDLRTHRTETFGRSACSFGYRESIFKTTQRGRYIILSVTLRLTKRPTYHLDYGALKRTLADMGVQELSVRAVSDAVIRIRRSKLPDPAEIGNAGSFFKNPVIDRPRYDDLLDDFPDMPSYPVEDGVKVPAGWLIDRAGWKGRRFGAYGVHAHQALVLVNHGGAAGSDIYALSETIRQDVLNTYGIALEREVNIV